MPKLFKFLLVGLPAFLIAVPLNWLFVEFLSLPKPLAYAIVLLVQVTINFFACIRFVFDRDSRTSLSKQFVVFLSGIMTARLLDWGLYTLLVQTTPIHYIVIQFGNVVILSFAKFAFAKRAIEGSKPRSSETSSTTHIQN